jgi:hypothetical protein
VKGVPQPVKIYRALPRPADPATAAPRVPNA